MSGANDEYDTLKGFVEAHKKAVAGGAAREVAVGKYTPFECSFTSSSPVSSVVLHLLCPFRV